MKQEQLRKLAYDKIKQAKQKCITNYCQNDSGILWEGLWKCENGKIMRKTCASGLFVDWYTFDTEENAIRKMVEELEIIGELYKERLK